MLNKIFSFLNRSDDSPVVRDLHAAIVEQARQPAFYAQHGVPDSLDGRFDMLVLHAYLAFRRLKELGQPAEAMSQQLFDLIFDDMDANLREIGVGDLSVGKKVKKMAQAFFGRAAAYDAGLEPGAAPDVLEQALRRNVYGTVANPAQNDLAWLAGYTRSAIATLAAQPAESLLKGRIGFPAP